MIITKHGMGWTIEPITSNQAEALDKVVEALRLQYPLNAVEGGTPQAIRSPLSGQTPSKASSCL